MSNIRQTSRHTVLVLVIALLIFCLYLAGKNGVSDIYAFQTRAYVEHWSELKTAPDESQWQAAFSSLSTALALTPDHPDYLEAMSGLYQWHLLLGNASVLPPREMLLKSKLLLRKSISLRPAWPYSWANLALVKGQLVELDEEYYNALKQATKLGPQEPKVHQILAQATLPYWLEFDEKIKNIVVFNAFRALNSNKQAFVAIANQYQMLSILCTKMTRSALVKQTCSDHMRSSSRK